jgi:hypothetical protein
MKRLGAVLILLFSGVLLACQLDYILPTPEPSAAPRATRTRTPVSPGSTFVPTSPAPTLLPIVPGGAGPVLATAREKLNMRAAPSASAQQIGTLNKGDTAQIVGRTAASDWWQIINPSNPNGRIWIAAGFVDVSGPVGTIPVVGSGSVPAPQPNPAQPKPYP